MLLDPRDPESWIRLSVRLKGLETKGRTLGIGSDGNDELVVRDVEFTPGYTRYGTRWCGGTCGQKIRTRRFDRRWKSGGCLWLGDAHAQPL